MLNTKYFLRPDNQGMRNAIPNPDRNGPAWFVNTYRLVANADEEINALTGFRSKDEAIVDERFASFVEGYDYTTRANGAIELTSYDNRNVVYQVNLDREQLAVFSEIYYAGGGKGWKAFINGQELPHFRANYVLRAAVLPAGSYKVEFVFDPVPFSKGVSISYASSGIFTLLLLIFAGMEFRGIKSKQDD